MYWVRRLDAMRNGYNLTEGGRGSHGRVVSQETRDKLSKIKTATYLTKETRERMSLSQKEKYKRYDSETLKHIREKVSRTMKGRHHSTETRAKMSASKIGKKRKPFSKEHRMRMIDAWKKRKMKTMKTMKPDQVSST